MNAIKDDLRRAIGGIQARLAMMTGLLMLPAGDETNREIAQEAVKLRQLAVELEAMAKARSETIPEVRREVIPARDLQKGDRIIGICDVITKPKIISDAGTTIVAFTGKNPDGSRTRRSISVDTPCHVQRVIR